MMNEFQFSFSDSYDCQRVFDALYTILITLFRVVIYESSLCLFVFQCNEMMDDRYIILLFFDAVRVTLARHSILRPDPHRVTCIDKK